MALATQTDQAGDSIVVLFVVLTTQLVVSVTDTESNTYDLLGTAPFFGANGACNASIWLAVNIAGSGSNVITATADSTGQASVLGITVRGVKAVPLDKNIDWVDDLVSPYVTQSTGTLSQANEIVIAAFADDSTNGAASANTSGFTNLVERVGAGGTNCMLKTLIVSSIAAKTCDMTHTGSTSSATYILSLMEQETVRLSSSPRRRRHSSQNSGMSFGLNPAEWY